MSDLSILCVTRAEPHAIPLLRAMRSVAFATGGELVVAADGEEAEATLRRELIGPVIPVRSAGFIESVLDEAIAGCSRDYVLRLDDDERCSQAMIRWLADGQYRREPHWKFSRMNLWGDEQHFLVTPHLWPDHQTRLSQRAMAGGRTSIHAGSPFGGGALAPVAILHEKFLVKSLAERREIVARYERLQPGAGVPFAPFSVPEDVYDSVGLAEVGDGQTREVVVQSTKLQQVAA